MPFPNMFNRGNPVISTDGDREYIHWYFHSYVGNIGEIVPIQHLMHTPDAFEVYRLSPRFGIDVTDAIFRFFPLYPDRVAADLGINLDCLPNDPLPPWYNMRDRYGISLPSHIREVSKHKATIIPLNLP